MNLKQRLVKLEDAAPDRGDGVKMVWNTVVRRDGAGLLIERPFRAVIVREPAASNETLTRHDSETQAAFFDRVLDSVRRVHGREDPVHEAEVTWKSDGRADISE
ncbi:hypothetical protein Rumeso_03428 [Rubellimicrobium mesophilum DSM 19309]|uniref:Uncharacterized protein n=1 Tax=Rubellimicrobium mesophilum DSM 19309 TaxID=442562 RepID=A0A017HMK3_9RHOB|nr:hypothetical protein [Rubellimicrobium mesophilum]EYD75004.1 hypothetical protein Rumeso_03428 [Rubellimicrobium mesophilum DSM 19309]